jgi:hypothetical protein
LSYRATRRLSHSSGRAPIRRSNPLDLLRAGS